MTDSNIEYSINPIMRKWIYRTISCLLVVSLLYHLCLVIFTNHSFTNINSFGFTEFLINFHGGFVRRGLLGEMLYQLVLQTGIAPYWPVWIICILSFAFVLFFFFKKFHEKGYCWWLLLSPMFLGNVQNIVRKDFLLYVILIAVFILISKPVVSRQKAFAATLLVILGLFIHEAFIFWGLPLFALILFTNKTDRIFNMLLIASVLVVFCILAVFKGTEATADAIWNSWNSLLPGAPLVKMTKNSIGAIGWETIDTFMYHVKVNLSGYTLIRILFGVLTYYLMTNFLFVFKSDKSTLVASDKTLLSVLYLSAMIFMLPMMMVLSCDYDRIYQYAAVSTFGAFLLLPHDKLLNLYPAFFIRFVDKLNKFLNSLLHPDKAIMVILIFVLAEDQGGFQFNSVFCQSVIGSLANISSIIIYLIISRIGV